MQHGLAQWQTFLADKPLPLLKRTKKDVQVLINQSHLSITQYAGPIIYDAGFSAHIFRHVNTQRHAKGKNPLTTMGNALSHLGQAAFQTFLSKSQLLDTLTLPAKNRQGYMRVMGMSCHAALQAKEWALQRNVAQTEETQLAALLQNITELMLWCYAEDVMPKIEALCYVKKMPYESAAKKILGCSMRELGADLAQQWHLPEMAQDGLLIKQDSFTLATGVSLASELARTVSVSWYGQVAQAVINRIARYKGKSEGEIERRLHLSAVNVNDEMMDKGYAAPAALLFQLADDHYQYPEFVYDDSDGEDKKEKETTQNSQNKGRSPALVKSAQALKSCGDVKQEVRLSEGKVQDVKKLAPREAILEKIKARKLAAKKREAAALAPLDKQPVTKSAIKSVVAPREGKNNSQVSPALAASIKELQQLIVQGKSSHDLIEHAVNTGLLCGVQRCVFLISIPKKAILVTKYAAYASDDIEIKRLKIPLDKPHVFKLLMEKKRGIFLNETNQKKYWGLIPESVKLVIGVKRYFSMSIFVNGYGMGLMYADKVKGELTQVEFSQFQGICKILSKGIEYSLKEKKAASNEVSNL